MGSFIAAASAASLHAFSFEKGELKGSFDSTFSLGTLYRVNDPDRALFGVANGGLQNSVNADDGNLNYPSGWSSVVFKGTHDLDLKYRNYGAFVRGTYFYDFHNYDSTKRRPLTNEALDRVGADAQWLDMYVRGTWDLGGRPFELRAGRQVLNMGESTFIPNGINVINAVDVARLRVPGSELREALLPVSMVKGSYSISERISAEAFWLCEFRRTEIDPAGTYFSTNDFASRGGSRVYLGFGSLSDRQPLGAVPRDLDREGSNWNQFGANLKLTVPKLNDTEFGLYFANYHSRLPVLSARTPTTPVNTDLTGPLTQVFMSSGQDAATASTNAANIWALVVLSQTNPGALTPTQLATLQAAQTQAAINGARSIALLTAAATGRYFVEYPESVKLFGASFNTSIPGTGIAWQGEVGYKHDQPLQIDDVELLFATLSALSPTFGGGNNQITPGLLGQMGVEIPGYRRKDVITAQNTFTKVFGPQLGANQFTVLGEFGLVYVPDLEDKGVLRYEGPGTFTSGSQAAMTNTTSPGSAVLPATPYHAFADKFSAGYQVLARLEYNNVFAGVNVLPTVAFTHDIVGNTPLPLGNFVAGRKSINLGAEFVFQNTWSLDVRYVNFFGARQYNLINDRDFVSATIKVSF